MEIQTSIKDVYPIINKNLPDYYKLISKGLGINNPFARITINHGYYIWDDERADWKQIDSADNDTKIRVEIELARAKKEVADRINQETADLLFTYPNDSYIYYCEENGSVKVLITGWGLKKSKGPEPEPGPEPILPKTPIKLSFVYDGEKLPNYEFGLQLEKSVKHLKTDFNCICVFEEAIVNKTYEIIDFNLKKTKTFTVEKGKSEYTIDVTRSTCVNIAVLLDNNPLPGEAVKLSYRGTAHDLVTDDNGKTSIFIPYHSNETTTITVRDQEKSLTVEEDTNNIIFNFKTEVPPPPPEPETFSKLSFSAYADGNPIVGEPIKVNCHDKDYEVVTDESGNATLEVPFHEGDAVTASMRDEEKQDVLKKEETKIVFNFETPQEPPKPVKLRFIFRDIENKPIKCKGVTFHQDKAEDITASLDENGEILIEEEKLKPNVPSRITLNGWKDGKTTIPFTIEPNEKEYIFQEQPDEVKKGCLLPQILAVIGAAIVLLAAWLFFETLFETLGEIIYN